MALSGLACCCACILREACVLSVIGAGIICKTGKGALTGMAARHGEKLALIASYPATRKALAEA